MCYRYNSDWRMKIASYSSPSLVSLGCEWVPSWSWVAQPREGWGVGEGGGETCFCWHQRSMICVAGSTELLVRTVMDYFGLVVFAVDCIVCRTASQLFTCVLTCISTWYGVAVNVWFIQRWPCTVDGRDVEIQALTNQQDSRSKRKHTVMVKSTKNHVC